MIKMTMMMKVPDNVNDANWQGECAGKHKGEQTVDEDDDVDDDNDD